MNAKLHYNTFMKPLIPLHAVKPAVELRHPQRKEHLLHDTCTAPIETHIVHFGKEYTVN